MANDDLVVAGDAEKREIYHLACFHAQQAAEKMLKAYIIFLGRPVPKTHNLRELYERIVPKPSGISEFKESIKILDQYYIPTRYPDALPGSLPEGLPTARHAREALEDVEKLAAFIHIACSTTL